MSKEFVKEGLKKALSPWDYAFKDNEVMVAGGLFTSLFTKQDVNDVDCYFRSKRQMLRFILDIAENESYPYFVNITDKSMTLTAPGEPTIQLIYFKYFDNLKEVFETFDFTISMCGYDYKTDEIETADDFWSDLAQRRLSFNPKTAFPLVSALRVNKFKDRGYNISRSQMIKIMLEVTKLDLKSPEDFVKHVGGHYGNAALKILQEEGEFSLEKALEKLSEIEGDSERNILFPNQFPEVTKDSMPLKAMVRILATKNPLEGGWYRRMLDERTGAAEAVYCIDSRHIGSGSLRKRSMPLNIALLFAKDKERKVAKIETTSGVYFKHVQKTAETGVYRSFHCPEFVYQLGKEKKDEHGMYLCTKEHINNHTFSRKSDGTIIACLIEFKDVIGSKGKEFRVDRLTPLFEVTDNVENIATTYQNWSPSFDLDVELETSVDIYEDIDEDVLDELLGHYEIPTQGVKGPAGQAGDETGSQSYSDIVLGKTVASKIFPKESMTVLDDL